MSDAPSYTKPVGIGEVMEGGTVSEVVASNVHQFDKGDIVVGRTGWQTQRYPIVPACKRSGPTQIPIQTALGVPADAKPTQDALRQHDRRRTMIKQFGDVSGQYARLVSKSRSPSNPFPRSAWEDLRIPKRASALDPDAPPSKSRDTGRSFTGFRGLR